jgi:hypothetical protein
LTTVLVGFFTALINDPVFINPDLFRLLQNWRIALQPIPEQAVRAFVPDDLLIHNFYTGFAAH